LSWFSVAQSCRASASAMRPARDVGLSWLLGIGWTPPPELPAGTPAGIVSGSVSSVVSTGVGHDLACAQVRAADEFGEELRVEGCVLLLGGVAGVDAARPPLSVGDACPEGVEVVLGHAGYCSFGVGRDG
jgi:hypothetical protein